MYRFVRAERKRQPQSVWRCSAQRQRIDGSTFDLSVPSSRLPGAGVQVRGAACRTFLEVLARDSVQRRNLEGVVVCGEFSVQVESQDDAPSSDEDKERATSCPPDPLAHSESFSRQTGHESQLIFLQNNSIDGRVPVKLASMKTGAVRSLR